jgi:hypothetical protein
MRTTIDLPDPLFRRVKTLAAMEGTSLKKLITDFIEQGLAAGRPGPGRERPLRSQPPVIRHPCTGSPVPALSNADIEALLADDDAGMIGRE